MKYLQKYNDLYKVRVVIGEQNNGRLRFIIPNILSKKFKPVDSVFQLSKGAYPAQLINTYQLKAFFSSKLFLLDSISMPFDMNKEGSAANQFYLDIFCKQKSIRNINLPSSPRLKLLESIFTPCQSETYQILLKNRETKEEILATGSIVIANPVIKKNLKEVYELLTEISEGNPDQADRRFVEFVDYFYGSVSPKRLLSWVHQVEK